MTALKSFARNTVGTDYVVGDIHGCFKLLLLLMGSVGFNTERDRLFSVGDLVDRGPNSESSLQWLGFPWFHAVRGNHEQMAIDYVRRGADEKMYALNGGEWFLSMKAFMQHSYADAFEELPYAIDIDTPSGKVGIVHAEAVPYDWELFTTLLEDGDRRARLVALWARDRISSKNGDVVTGLSKLYVGHTPLKDTMTLGNVVYLDTGAVYDGALSIVNLTTGEITSARVVRN